jgi:cysteine dioxygenase
MNIDYISKNLIIKDTINETYNIDLIKTYLYQPINIQPKEKYQKTLLFRNNNFEIYQINWLKNAETNIHYHPKRGCIMKIIKGSLQEKLYQSKIYNIGAKDFMNKYEIKNSFYNMNDVSYIDDTIGLHKIIAIEESISLHIYSPPKFYE